MSRTPGVAWLTVLAAAVVLVAASAALSPSGFDGGALLAEGVRRGIAPDPTTINPRALTGAGALVIAALLFLLFFYRRRPYILLWMSAWILFSASMFAAARQYSTEQAGWMAYGFSQFLAILSTAAFAMGARAYPARPRVPNGLAHLLVPLLLWFALAPLLLGPAAAFVPGHVLIAAGLALAGVAHFMLLRNAPVLGATLVGASLLAIAGSHVWLLWHVPAPDAEGATRALFFSLVPYLIAALGMQLLTFEDITGELRRTNRRLEAAQGKLRRLVITDALTGCRNRRFFDEIIRGELQRHRRFGIPLSVLFIDVDQFKAVNDRLGHDAGDRVLRHIAIFLLDNVREADYVFRWGGDEFVVLLSCPEEEARRRAAALQAGFEAWLQTAQLPGGLGLSVGCAEVPAGLGDITAVIELADARMYEAKKRHPACAPRRKGSTRGGSLLPGR